VTELLLRGTWLLYRHGSAVMGENESETVTRESASPRTVTGVSSGNDDTSHGRVWTLKPPLPSSVGEQRGIIRASLRNHSSSDINANE
jgi:hypothetical protein